MEIRQLRYFLSAVRLGSIGSSAAEHLVTQPAVSIQIRNLENEVGERLFERRGRRVFPTEAGRLLARHAEDVLARVDELGRAMHGLRGLEAGHLRLGNIDAASVYVLPDVYRDFHAQYPGVRIEIVVGDTRHLLQLLAAGEVELATTTLPVDAEGFMTRTIYREEMVPVVGRGSELLRGGRVTLDRLSQEGIIAYPSGSTTRRLIEQVFIAHGKSFEPRMEISSPEAIKRLASAGLGVAILPRPVVEIELASGELHLLSTGRARFQRTIGMVFRSEESLSPAAREFLRMVEKRFKNTR